MKIIKGYTVTESIILYTEHITVNMMYLYKYIISLLNAVIYPFKKLYKLYKRIKNILYHLYHRLLIKIKRWYKEILLTIGFLTGWTLFTHGIALILGNSIYYLSFGGLLLSLCGYKFIFKVFIDGIYVLSQKGD